jgi:hypothetical protein
MLAKLVSCRLHRSQQAYMIVYGLASEDDLDLMPVPTPADRASDQVQAENLAWEADGEAYEKR